MPEPSADSPRVGFIGLGRMGLPMCRNLLQAGVHLTVFNRTAGRAAPLLDQGAQWAATPAELADQVDILLTCLGTVEATEAALSESLAALRPGMLVADHGTMGPDTARRLGTGLAGHGVEFLDAPVSGGPEGAVAGTLTIMCGGSEAAFGRLEPVVRSYGRLVVRVGEVGTGSLLKLVNQLLTFVHGTAAAEALAFARKAGLDLGTAGEVLRQSFGQSRMLERALPRIESGNYDAGAALKLYHKDLGLLLGAGGDAGAALPLTGAALAVLEQALEAGLSDRDITALYLWYDQRSS